jgi:glutamate N-acetyltransferase / amino-acid N-acetyltransferase
MDWIAEAHLTTPQGWSAGAAETGIKTYGATPRFDVGLLVSRQPATVAGIFTRNRICGAPVTLTRARVRLGMAQGLVVNSGCSNVAMGAKGLADAERMTELAAHKLGLDSKLVLVGSTGVIGRPLPMDRIRRGLEDMELSAEGGAPFTRAMMTTDTVPKSRGVSFDHDGIRYVLAGAAKGSGMAHPDMATVFCFLTTDAQVSATWLDAALRRVADDTINMVDVDMDTSTSDMMLVMANGAAAGPAFDDDPRACEQLESAMLQVCTALARDIARDGEGATRLITVTVHGAISREDARRAARTVVSSPLVKTMVAGKDPNLGRVLMAVGRSGAELYVDKMSVQIGEHAAFLRGEATDTPYELLSAAMDQEEVTITVDLGIGEHSATAYGCDMTEEYVRINADYTT